MRKMILMVSAAVLYFCLNRVSLANDIMCQFSEDGKKLIVTGTGKFTSNSCSDFLSKRGELTEVIFGNQITSVGSYAFSGANKLISVSMPNVVNVESGAFSYISSLKNVYMPNVENIEMTAFRMTDLKDIYLPKVKSIASYAFGDINFDYIGIPENVNIEAYAFNSDVEARFNNANQGSGMLNCNKNTEYLLCSRCLYYMSGRGCVANCGSGYVAENGYCVMENCSNGYIKNATGCVSECGDGYFIKDGICVSNCGKGYYSIDNKYCLINPVGCDVYNGSACDICSSDYLEKGTGCVSKKNGCGAGYRQFENFCNRIRYTPAEAAKVLRYDNTNEVTITFRK